MVLPSSRGRTRSSKASTGEVRDGCLNLSWFVGWTMPGGSSKRGGWVTITVWPHSSLADRTLAEFAAEISGKKGGRKDAVLHKLTVI
jgi:hypothetical protein